MDLPLPVRYPLCVAGLPQNTQHGKVGDEVLILSRRHGEIIGACTVQRGRGEIVLGLE